MFFIRNQTKEADNNNNESGVLSLKDAIDLIKFYEDSASKKKDHVWTLTTWILTLNTAIITFCFTFYTQKFTDRAFLLFEIIACIAGIALCIFLLWLIRDQGQHISSDWTYANKIKANKETLHVLLNAGELDKVKFEGYRASFPRFCKRLVGLSWLFIIGFAGIMTIMIWLSCTLPTSTP